jgi:hypothetical protein
MAEVKASTIKGFLLGILLMVVLLGAATGGAIADRLFVFKPLDILAKRAASEINAQKIDLSQKVLKEDSVVIDVADKVSPSVVTVSITEQRAQLQPFFMDPFGMFGGSFFQRPNGERYWNWVCGGCICGINCDQ